jgi:hypothetical protein
MVQESDWLSYVAARASALGRPLDLNVERKWALNAAPKLLAYLGLGNDQVNLQVRRCTLYARDSLFHQLFLFLGGIHTTLQVVDRIHADNIPPTRGTNGPRGTIAVTLHYSLATSLLLLWLGRASAIGRISHFCFFIDSRGLAGWRLSPERLAQFRSAGYEGTQIDKGTEGVAPALQQALRLLRAGAFLLIFADGRVLEPTDSRAIQCRLGSGTIALPRGVAWLSEKSGVQILPMYIRPEGDTHRITFGDRYSSEHAGVALQTLFDDCVMHDPAPWEYWLRDHSARGKK